MDDEPKTCALRPRTAAGAVLSDSHVGLAQVAQKEALEQFGPSKQHMDAEWAAMKNQVNIAAAEPHSSSCLWLVDAPTVLPGFQLPAGAERQPPCTHN